MVRPGYRRFDWICTRRLYILGEQPRDEFAISSSSLSSGPRAPTAFNPTDARQTFTRALEY